MRRDTAVDDEFLNVGNLENVLVPQPLAQRRNNPFLVFFIKLGLHSLFRLPFLLLCALWLGLHDLDVRDVDGSLARNNRSVRIILRFADALLDQAHAFDQHLLFLRQQLQNFSSGSPMVAGDDLDFVPFLYMETQLHHRTSGASEMIFMKFFSRNSRATGPKIRVPLGLRSLSMITIALLSNRRYDPSSRLTGCRVRTTTARTTSPFLTVPLEAASLTLHVITSPTPA